MQTFNVYVNLLDVIDAADKIRMDPPKASVPQNPGIASSTDRNWVFTVGLDRIKEIKTVERAGYKPATSEQDYHWASPPLRKFSRHSVENDPVAHPSHYNAGKIEVIEALEDWGLGFHLGNVVKYVARAGKKDPAKEIEDLEKASWYLRRKIELLQSSKEGRDPVRPNDMKKG